MGKKDLKIQWGKKGTWSKNLQKRINKLFNTVRFWPFFAIILKRAGKESGQRPLNLHERSIVFRDVPIPHFKPIPIPILPIPPILFYLSSTISKSFCK